MAKGGADLIVEKVKKLADPVCDSAGIALVHVEYQRESSGRILRLYIDKAGGVTLEDCAVVSREVGDLLDIYVDGLDAYRMEVSSPGRQRPLGKMEDYIRFTGEKIKIKTSVPLDGQKSFTGILCGVEDGHVLMKNNQKKFRIPMTMIRRGNLAG